MDDPGRPDYPDDVSYVDPRRRDRRLQIALTVVAAILLIGAVFLFTRSPGPPTTPVGVQVEAQTCGEPCTSIEPLVTVSWTPPEAGADPTGYRLLRDGEPLEASIDSSTLTFVDRAVTIGENHEYQVVALSTEGDSAATEAVEAWVPTPPEDTARLHGVYRVNLEVRTATAIGSAFGIQNPLPGKRGKDEWSFVSTCSDVETACSSTWSSLDGEIAPDGDSWTGRVEGRPARCGPNRRAPAPIEIDFTSLDAAPVDGAWVVSGFHGTATVSFRCPGFPAASATVEVTGHL